MNKRLYLAIIMILLAGFLISGCKSGGKDAAKDVFRVGLEADYPPFNWTQASSGSGGVKIDGSPEYAGGYDVEIAKRIAEGLGKELVIVKTEWDGLTPSLTSGKIDAIIAGMSPTENRKKTIDFSDVYYESDLVMVVKAGSEYENATSIQDFAGAKVTAQLNTFHYEVIDQIEGVNKQAAMDNFPAMRVALQSGFIDGYVSERPEGVSAQTANEDFKMVSFEDGFKTSPDDTAVAVGLKKGSTLTPKINEILEGISVEERLEIMNQAIKNQPISN
ncbi:MAG: transporter substrate-binding domain-containing protein [Firmicutes bacterium]|mgnify:CR=1 FL=1|nr:transporter substrate-binding domain-containing protein [Bacillota bacterium]